MSLHPNLEKLLITCITEHKEHVYRLAFSYVKNQEDALDIVQEAIHKAFASVESLKNTASMKSWFYRIVVNTSLDFLRKHKKMQVVDETMLEAMDSGSEDVYANMDLEIALNELPTMYRSVITLRYFEDLKIDEIAEVLSENISTIKTRLYQALRLLRIRMNDENPEEAL
ncbi:MULTISPECIES: RNA polymerase sigma factor [Paenibacillus]|uniref:RNA polymerase sigma factor n=1 Tax=Paenibacillus violae TaxID=3077234 RepID=A0ABU3RB07_9BACL|nr:MULTISPECIES: RNA polymerase sigma factor [Paenibacillus]MDU0201256.1 RNA polymerase sigma factor [Paenibacillus sp. PFR10]MEC0265114.1 RNA polymerase sigma factor [Paenibacillus anseongense]